MDVIDYNKEFTVSEISRIIKNEFESKFTSIKIRGEISGLKAAPSGHLYFSLKDKDSLISAICWRGTISLLKFKPEEGAEVVCTGNITTYANQSKYQIIINAMEHAGAGALMAMLEKRKKQFASEGLFDQIYKKPLPFLPTTIGVITSPTGAVIRDILHRIKDRFPLKILLWPVLVQGEKSAEQITEAINGFNNLTENIPELIIIARGGGSLEDLWSFNEENVIRAAFNSKIPIISAVGHETDFTLLDFVADKRAPTPTAAAEMAVPVRNDLIMVCHDYRKRMYLGLNRLFKMKQHSLVSLSRALPKYDNLLANFIQKIDDLSLRMAMAIERKFYNYLTLLEKFSTERLALSINRTIKDKIHKYNMQAALLNSYSYQNTLKRGYTLIRKNNKIITSINNVNNNDNLTIEFKDGIKQVTVD